jgi:hypothetical protein
MKLLFKLLILSTAILLAACSGNKFPEPDEVLTDYLLAVYTGQNEVAYEYVSSQDKSVKGLKEYLSENRTRANPLARLFVDEFEVRVSSLKQSDEHAAIKAAIIKADLKGMLRELEEATGKSIDPRTELKATALALKQKYEDEDVPTVYENKIYRMVNEMGSWKIHLDWQAELLEKAREEQIAQLLAEARELRKSDSSLEAAVEKYKEVLELDSNMLIASQGIKDTQRDIAEYNKKLDYIENVALYDLEAKFYKTFSERTVPGVKFKLKNNGDRLLREVEVTVYFKDVNGTVIAEERYHPVMGMNESYSGNQVLKKNYIWQMEEGNFYKADGVPTEWQEGAVEAKVTNLKFAE